MESDPFVPGRQTRSLVCGRCRQCSSLSSMPAGLRSKLSRGPREGQVPYGYAYGRRRPVRNCSSLHVLMDRFYQCFLRSKLRKAVDPDEPPHPPSSGLESKGICPSTFLLGSVPRRGTRGSGCRMGWTTRAACVVGTWRRWTWPCRWRWRCMECI